MENNVVSLFSELPKLRVVVIDCPIETWHNTETRDLFSEMVQLKIDGYGAEYSHRALPLDASDWFGTHILIVQEAPVPKVILGYKFAALERCEEFNQTFPGLTIPSTSHADSHTNRVQQIIEACRKSGKNIGYVGSWTIHPQARENRPLTALLRELVASTHQEYQQTYGVEEMLICGMIRFKTDVWQQGLGYRPLSFNNQELPAFEFKALNGEPAKLLHLTRPSDLAASFLAKHRSYWLNRKTLASVERLAKIASQRKIAA